MPSTTVHLFVAENIADRLLVTDKAQFLLGAISPDAVNLDGFASQEIRYNAHLRSLDTKLWRQNIKSYFSSHLQEFKASGGEDFLKGFAVHLLTDILWDECVQPKMFAELLKSGISEENLRKEKWEELSRLDYLLSDDERYKSIISLLKESPVFAVSTVSKELLLRFKEQVTGKSFLACGRPLVLSTDDVELVSEKVALEFGNIIA